MKLVALSYFFVAIGGALGAMARYALNVEFASPAGWILQGQLTLAASMFESALWREESRGVHYRLDFPDPRPEFAEGIGGCALLEAGCDEHAKCDGHCWVLSCCGCFTIRDVGEIGTTVPVMPPHWVC